MSGRKTEVMREEKNKEMEQNREGEGNDLSLLSVSEITPAL